MSRQLGYWACALAWGLAAGGLFNWWFFLTGLAIIILIQAIDK